MMTTNIVHMYTERFGERQREQYKIYTNTETRTHTDSWIIIG